MDMHRSRSHILKNGHKVDYFMQLIFDTFQSFWSQRLFHMKNAYQVSWGKWFARIHTRLLLGSFKSLLISVWFPKIWSQCCWEFMCGIILNWKEIEWCWIDITRRKTYTRKKHATLLDSLFQTLVREFVNRLNSLVAFVRNVPFLILFESILHLYLQFALTKLISLQMSISFPKNTL